MLSDLKAFHLVQFAIMGEAYAKYILKIKKPAVGLLSNGEEESKGNELIRETNAILRKSSIGYIGPVEGRDIFNGRANVVICDGFVGNAALKICEGLAEAIGSMIKEEVKGSWMAKMAYLLARGAVNDIKKKLDYSEYGGGTPPGSRRCGDHRPRPFFAQGRQKRHPAGARVCPDRPSQAPRPKPGREPRTPIAGRPSQGLGADQR